MSPFSIAPSLASLFVRVTELASFVPMRRIIVPSVHPPPVPNGVFEAVTAPPLPLILLYWNLFWVELAISPEAVISSLIVVSYLLSFIACCTLVI